MALMFIVVDDDASNVLSLQFIWVSLFLSIISGFLCLLSEMLSVELWF